MTDFEDYYEILGVGHNATPEEITRAYRDKCFIVHPDRLTGSPESAKEQSLKELIKINQAYDVLKDQSQRREYLSRWLKQRAPLQLKVKHQQEKQPTPSIMIGRMFFNRYLIISAGIVIVLICLFTVRINQEYPDVETYDETENRTEYKMETFIETVNEISVAAKGEEYLRPQSVWFNAAVTRYGLPFNYYGFELNYPNHSKIQIKISISLYQNGFVAIYDLTNIGQIPIAPTITGGFGHGWIIDSQWLESFNSKLSAAPVLGSLSTNWQVEKDIEFDALKIRDFAIVVNSWQTNAVSSVKINWANESIVQKMVERERKVPYQVPHSVQKQRQVTKTRMVSLWDILWSTAVKK